jgi:hypothetical protein
MNELQTVTISELYKKGNITNLSTLRYNENNYPFVTLLGKDKSATNVYFSKAFSSKIEGLNPKTDLVTSGIINRDTVIVKTLNKDGEVRFKISSSENENYTSKSSLDVMFGESESEVNFDLTEFLQTFTKVEERTVVPQA